MSSRSAVKRPVRSRANWGRRTLIAATLGMLLGAGAASPWGDALLRMSVDFLLPLRHLLNGPLYPPQRSAVAAIVIDEETYDTPPFAGTPKVAWTPHLADIIQAVSAAGAKVIGLDLVYPTSLDRPGFLKGYDRPLLRALLKSGRQGKLVMGEFRLSARPVSPTRGQIIAVGGPRNVRMLNFIVDFDEVVRRYPGAFAYDDGGTAPSFGVELAARAGARPPDGEFLINFNTAPNPLPIFSFADIWACVRAGETGFLARHFRDKVVLIGASLDFEDRSIPARRFVRNRFDNIDAPRCAVKPSTGRFDTLSRRSIPGVFIHAAAINTLIKGRPLTPLNRPGTFAFMGVSIFALVLFYFLVPPAIGVLGGTGILAGEAWFATTAFADGMVLPLVPLAVAAVAAGGYTYGYRFVVEGRERRRIKHAFRHFLAPELVEKLANDSSALVLGGESKVVTVFFSDIQGFTTISEAMKDDPETLVEILNRYLTVMTTQIERNGGYVDKFIGDAVMAVWGAPLDDPDAARHAVDAALDCHAALADFNRDVIATDYGLGPIGTRIGINTGPAVVGNMGSETRLNYTITGDIVNLAARLEGANKTFGTRIMIGEDTARGLSETHLLRRLDRLVVQGKTVPVKVFEVVGRLDEVSGSERAHVADFHAALALYYRRRFAAARDAFAAMAGTDAAAKLYMERCQHYSEAPPPVPWNRAFVMTSK